MEDRTISGDRVREIRRAVGMTQQQFAKEVGVAKVTVARWESGSRICRADYVKRVRRIEAEQTAGSQRTTTLFDLDAREVQALDATAAVKAFGDLLRCECSRLGIPTSEVSIGNREVADGGIDAIVPTLQQSTLGSFLREGANYFQIKAGLSWKPWRPGFARNELLGKRKRLGKLVEQCLATGGRYVLVSFGTDLIPDQRQSACENIRTVFADAGFAEADVAVWGVQELIGHFGRFPFLSLRLSGRDDLQFQSWESWHRSGEMSTFLELGEAQEQFCERIRRLVRDRGVGHVRVIGEPGLGKTRLVHEALAADDLAPLVVYVQHAEDFQRSRLFHHLLHPDADYFLILVLDECTPRECKEIWDRLSSHSKWCPVVSLDHDSVAPGDEQFELECPPLGEEQLARIIDSYTGGGGDSSRWAELCSGVPRVAHAIGRNLQTNPADLLRAPSMNMMWDRFISGYRALDSTEAREKLIVLRHLALFQRFGFESPVHEEGEFISELVRKADGSITYERFQAIVADLKQQRILQGQTTLFIAPKLLHIYLWIEFWEKHGRSQYISELIRRIPKSLMRWFVGMFPYAGESRVASHHVNCVLGQDGAFSDREFALSDLGCLFLHELASASPEATLNCLERVFDQTTRAELLSFHQGRQHIVWALECIAVWPKLFCRAARLLRKLAESENDNFSNNSTGTFVGLFCLAPGQVAPTGATPEARLPVLIETLSAASGDTRRLGIKACKSAMDVHSGFRVVGPEYQGLKTAELWTPDTWEEVYAAMGHVWDRLLELSRSWSLELRQEANRALIDSATGLLQVSTLADRVLETLEKLVDDDATDLKQFVEFFARIERFWKDDYDSKVFDRLKSVDVRVTGSSFSDHMRRIVHLSSWDDLHDEDRFNQRVTALAIEAAQSEGKFRDVLPELVRGTNNVVFQFGREFARHESGRHLQATVERYRVDANRVSPLFISGYLATVFDTNRRQWEVVVTDLLGDEKFKDIIGPVIRNSGATDDVILKLLDQYDSGALDVSCLRSFGYSRCLKDLKEDTFLALVERLRSANENAFALEFLDFVYCQKGHVRRLPEAETLQILRAHGPTKSGAQENAYHWSVVAEQFVQQFPTRRTELFDAVLDKVANRDWLLNAHNHAYAVIQSIIQAEPNPCWEMVAARLESTDGIERYRLVDWLGPGISFGDSALPTPLALFPMNAVFDWIDEDPESRACDLTRAVPKTLDHDDMGVWARELLNRYGGQEDVRRRLLSHFWAGGWSGKLSDRYRGMRKRAREWLDAETSMRVREWLEEFIHWLSRDIEHAEIDEERSF